MESTEGEHQGVQQEKASNNESHEVAFTASSEWQKATKQDKQTILAYLQDVPQFIALDELREKGWSNSSGDKYFETKRRAADTANRRTARHFYTMMQKIGEQLQEHTSAFKITTDVDEPRILDFCMAPGGFLSTALRFNPTSQVLAFSLPRGDGGHEVLLKPDSRVNINFRDITMLAGDMGVTELPPNCADHPDAKNLVFHPQLVPETLFDLIICDGQVLRTQERASYRQNREPLRLALAQLSMGLQRLRSGGTVIVLLHKADMPETLSLLYTFNKFARIQLYKPQSAHAIKSSFYLVAKNVWTQHPEAIHAVEQWKMLWKAATFEDDAGFEDACLKHCPEVQTMLDEFGVEFIRLATPIWRVQAKALAEVPWTK